MEATMPQEFRCKTCNKPILFTYSPADSGVGVLGNMLEELGNKKNEEKKKVIAYLMCEDGHEHPYIVEI